MTTAGFDPGPRFSLDRVIDFRRNVDAARESMAEAPGSIHILVFSPHVRGDDGAVHAFPRAAIRGHLARRGSARLDLASRREAQAHGASPTTCGPCS